MKSSNMLTMADPDVCFQTPDNKRFRLRAAAIIIEKGCVLFATNESEKYYYSIGGGVHFGETMEDAVQREVLEETGVPYEIDRLAFVHENFFSRNDGMFKGLTCHEITFYFLMKSRGTQKLNSNSFTLDGTLKEHMCWLPIDQLSSFDAYPRFFAEKLKDLPPYPQHIVTKQ